jgi:hydrogenase-4 component F
MGLFALLGIPVAGAVASAVDPHRARRQAYLLLAAAAHLVLLALAWGGRLGPSSWLWLSFDALGGIVLTLVSVVFLAVAVYGIGHYRRDGASEGRLYQACLLGFLASASAVCLSGHLGVMWVAMETTTLAMAPLIYDPSERHSIEAVWKYLLLCSVGIALALLGTFMLAVAHDGPTGSPTLLLPELLRAPTLEPTWFKAAFVFLFVGYGTKVGLAPMHTWLPDAHGEAPSPISALLSGALLACAFLAILRIVQVAHAAGQSALLSPVLIGFGLVSMLVAAALLLRQTNYKRMLAYSSVEQMGILAVGSGLGGDAALGALVQMVGSSLCKASLFFVAGNMLVEYGSKRISDVSGLIRRLPVSGVLWVLGFFALMGSPPFVLFVSELLLLRGAMQAGQPWVAAALLALQMIVFLGMAPRIVAMAQGESARGRAESATAVVPAAILLLLVLALGAVLLGPLRRPLADAAATLGGPLR